MTVSYAITVHNEHFELNRLLTKIYPILEEGDEIVVQGDAGRVTDEVVSVLSKFVKKSDFTYIEYSLNSDYATFKNNLIKNCKCDYVFVIDADEYCNNGLITYLKTYLREYPDIDVFNIPRVNTVSDITDEYVQLQRWNKQTINGVEVINFPDYQQRLFKRDGRIKYVNPVHERLIGYTKMASFPIMYDATNVTFDFCLIHDKTFERQIQQNKFYETF